MASLLAALSFQIGTVCGGISMEVDFISALLHLFGFANILRVCWVWTGAKPTRPALACMALGMAVKCALRDEFSVNSILHCILVTTFIRVLGVGSDLQSLRLIMAFMVLGLMGIMLWLVL